MPPCSAAPPPISPVRPAADSPVILPGWGAEDHLAAFEAYAAGCGVARDKAARTQCARAQLLRQTSRHVTTSAARSFFETGFTVIGAETADGSPGLLTAYFAPEYPARTRPDREFDAPVLAAPQGWTRGQVLPPRVDIEAAPPARALAWMRAEDLFFMQIQGSGYLTLEDGRRVTVLGDWDGSGQAGGEGSVFLRRLREGACRVFSTVLTPDYNDAHRDHFHFDGAPYSLCATGPSRARRAATDSESG